MAALATFYLSVVLHGDLYWGSAVIVVWKYVAGGCVTGSAMGLLRALYARSGSWTWALPLAAAFVLEPLAWRLHGPGVAMPSSIPVLEAFAAAVVILAAWGVHAGRSSRAS